MRKLDRASAFARFDHLPALNAFEADAALAFRGWLVLEFLLFLCAVDDQELRRVFGLVGQRRNHDGEGRCVRG